MRYLLFFEVHRYYKITWEKYSHNAICAIHRFSVVGWNNQDFGQIRDNFHIDFTPKVFEACRALIRFRSLYLSKPQAVDRCGMIYNMHLGLTIGKQPTKYAPAYPSPRRIQSGTMPRRTRIGWKCFSLNVDTLVVSAQKIIGTKTPFSTSILPLGFRGLLMGHLQDS